MKLTRTWLGEKYECPASNGSADSWKDFGEYRVSWNSGLGYWSVARFNKDAWRDWFQTLKSEALELKKGDIMDAQEMLHRLIKDGADNMRDELWDVFFVQSQEEHAEDLLSLVPKCYQENYKDTYGNVWTWDIVKDYSKKVLDYVTSAGVI